MVLGRSGQCRTEGKGKELFLCYGICSIHDVSPVTPRFITPGSRTTSPLSRPDSGSSVKDVSPRTCLHQAVAARQPVIQDYPRWSVRHVPCFCQHVLFQSLEHTEGNHRRPSFCDEVIMWKLTAAVSPRANVGRFPIYSSVEQKLWFFQKRIWTLCQLGKNIKWPTSPLSMKYLYQIFKYLQFK